jgi:hypothetical protein
MFCFSFIILKKINYTEKYRYKIPVCPMYVGLLKFCWEAPRVIPIPVLFGCVCTLSIRSLGKVTSNTSITNVLVPRTYDKSCRTLTSYIASLV